MRIGRVRSSLLFALDCDAWRAQDHWSDGGDHAAKQNSPNKLPLSNPLTSVVLLLLSVKHLGRGHDVLAKVRPRWCCRQLRLQERSRPGSSHRLHRHSKRGGTRSGFAHIAGTWQQANCRWAVTTSRLPITCESCRWRNALYRLTLA